MSVDLVNVADILHTLEKLCRNPPPDDARLKAIILASSRDGIRGLQTALGVKADGIFGPITEKAFDAVDVRELIEEILEIASPPGVPPPTQPIPTVPSGDPTQPTQTPPTTPTQPAPTPIVPAPNPSPTSAPTIPNSVEYATHFTSMTINSDRLPEIQAIARKIQQNMSRYESVANAIGMTYWPLIGAIHNLESSINFNTHLYNGDPLTERTVHHPIGRPTTGDPPFTWEFSATDALRYEGWDAWYDWTILGMAYMSEKYNGFGYRNPNHKVPSPYLWSGSSIYVKGFYTKDGVFDPNAVSRQIGTMTMLRYFYDQGKT